MNKTLIIFLILFIWFMTFALSEPREYDGLTAEQWANEYNYLSDCVEFSSDLSEAKSCL